MACARSVKCPYPLNPHHLHIVWLECSSVSLFKLNNSTFSNVFVEPAFPLSSPSQAQRVPACSWPCACIAGQCCPAPRDLLRIRAEGTLVRGELWAGANLHDHSRDFCRSQMSSFLWLLELTPLYCQSVLADLVHVCPPDKGQHLGGAAGALCFRHEHEHSVSSPASMDPVLPPGQGWVRST